MDNHKNTQANHDGPAKDDNRDSTHGEIKKYQKWRLHLTAVYVARSSEKKKEKEKLLRMSSLILAVITLLFIFVRAASSTALSF